LVAVVLIVPEDKNHLNKSQLFNLAIVSPALLGQGYLLGRVTRPRVDSAICSGESPVLG